MTGQFNDDDWRPCKSGELQHLRTNLPGLRRGLKASPTLATCFLVLLLAATWFGWQQAFRDPPDQPTIPVALNCQDVRSLLQGFRNGELDAEIATRIQHHVDRCDPCRQAYEDLFAGRRPIHRRLRKLAVYAMAE